MLAMTVIGAVMLAFYIKGGLWLSERALPWAFVISIVGFCVVIFLLLPLAIPRKTRSFSSTSIFVISYVFGTTLWMLGFLFSYKAWGLTGVTIGILLGGVGVVPVALLATLIKGAWAGFSLLVGLIIMTYASRVGALRLAESLEAS